MARRPAPMVGADERDALKEEPVVDDVDTRQRVLLRGASVIQGASGRFRESRVKGEASAM